MAKFQINDSVNVGGCVGKITEIADHQIIVEGVYVYPFTSYCEEWRAAFIENDVKDVSKVHGQWDFTNIYAVWS